MNLRQDIDLLQRPPVRWEEKILRVEVMLLLVLVIVAVGLVFGLSIMMRQSQISKELSALSLLENQRQLTLSQLQDLLDPGKRQAEQDQKISSLRRQLAIYADQTKFQPGFSQPLNDLTHLAYHGVWLTRIRLNNTESGSIHLEGQAQSSALLSEYLAELQNQTGTLPQRIRQIVVQQDKSQLLHFVLDSHAEAPH